MVQIPDNMRPTVDMLAKHAFWIFAVLVPLIALPALLVGSAGVSGRIAARRAEIASKLTQLRQVSGNPAHPNEQWSQAIEAEKQRADEELMAEWQRFWDSQQAIRVWPEELGATFIRRVQSLKPGGKLDRPDLLNYQRRVPRFVEALPPRMGAESAMAAGAGVGMRGAAQFGPDAAEPGMGPGMDGGLGGMMGRGGGPRSIITWNPADQQTLYQSFLWDRPPSTMQVLMAQEELWIYGVLCDLLREVNATATGGHDSAVPFVEELAVGYRAAEDQPGGVGRIYLPASAGPAYVDNDTGDGGMDMGADFSMDGEGMSGGRPPHPRFQSAGGLAGAGRMGMGMGGAEDDMMGGGGTREMSQDDMFLSWAYVDFSGKPLLAEELASTPGVAMTRLMPFLLRAVVDQRKLDMLLVTMATWPVPLDVRQVRINPGSVAGDVGMDGPGGMMGGGGGGGLAARARMAGITGRGGVSRPGGMGGFGGSEVGSSARLRPHDVTVEILGTVAIATPPGSKPPEASGSDSDDRFGTRLPAGRPARGQTAWTRRTLRDPATLLGGGDA